MFDLFKKVFCKHKYINEEKSFVEDDRSNSDYYVVTKYKTYRCDRCGKLYTKKIGSKYIERSLDGIMELVLYKYNLGLKGYIEKESEEC